jgi:hypothetical protein
VASVIAGIVLVIAAVILWLGHLTVDHALAILIGVIGVLILLFGVVPVTWVRR